MATGKMNDNTPKPPYLGVPGPGAKVLGYTVMRAGLPGKAQSACIVYPHIGNIEKATFDAQSRRFEAWVGGAQIALVDMPEDIGEMLTSRPQDVLLLAVDTLARARSSDRASEIL